MKFVHRLHKLINFDFKFSYKIQTSFIQKYNFNFQNNIYYIFHDSMPLFQNHDRTEKYFYLKYLLGMAEVKAIG